MDAKINFLSKKFEPIRIRSLIEPKRAVFTQLTRHHHLVDVAVAPAAGDDHVVKMRMQFQDHPLDDIYIN